MIKCLIWDVGETILAYDFPGVMGKLARISGKSSEEVRQILGGDCFDRRSLIYRFDAGEMETEEFIATVRDRLGIDHTIPSALIMDMFYHHRMPKETETLLRFFKKSYIQGIVSNMSSLQWSHIEHIFPILSEVHGIMDFQVLSFREKLMKPDWRIYERAFRRAYGVYEMRKDGLRHCEFKHSNCLFLDDRKDNIKGALDFGFRAVRVQPASKVGHRGMVEALQREGIVVPPSRSGHRKRH